MAEYKKYLKKFFLFFKFKRKHDLKLFLVLIFCVLAIWSSQHYFSRNQTGSPVTTPDINPPVEISPVIKEFGLRIDKISLLLPVIKNVDGANKTLYNKALQGGVAHYKEAASPGEKGNIFIFGHSSSATDSGPYAKAFGKLNDLEKNDAITVYYENKEFSYKVSEKKIIEKDDLGVLNPTKNETLTLMTCWPIGTSEQRLIIRAQRID